MPYFLLVKLMLFKTKTRANRMRVGLVTFKLSYFRPRVSSSYSTSSDIRVGVASGRSLPNIGHHTLTVVFLRCSIQSFILDLFDPRLWSLVVYSRRYLLLNTGTAAGDV